MPVASRFTELLEAVQLRIRGSSYEIESHSADELPSRARSTPGTQLERRSRNSSFMTVCRAKLHCLSPCSLNFVPLLLESRRMHPGQLDERGGPVQVADRTSSKCTAIQAQGRCQCPQPDRGQDSPLRDSIEQLQDNDGPTNRY